MARPDEKTGHETARRWGLLAGLAGYLAVFGLFAFLTSHHIDGQGLMVTLVFVECAALSALVVAVVVDIDPRRLGIVRFLLKLTGFCGMIILVSALVITFSAKVWGAEPLMGGLAGQLVILSFCLLLGAVYAIVRCAGSEPFLAQLVSISVACLLIGSIFYADPLIEARKSAESRSVTIQTVLSVNPITAISWSLMHFDLMRHRVMYDRISVIGRFYRTEYPPWWRTLTGYLAVSAVMLAGAELLRRRRFVAGGETRRF